MNDRLGFDEAMARRWRHYRPPARPSPGDVAVYEAAMASHGDVLLLGSTPEVRTLGRRLGNQLTAVDASRENYVALGSLAEGDMHRETFVRADWLEMDLGRQFDLVIGDGSVNMLHPSSHQAFLDRVAQHVRPAGLLLLRAYVATAPRFETVEEVIGNARVVPGDFYTAVKIHLSQLWLDRGTGGLSNDEFWGAMQDLHREGNTTNEEHAQLATILADDALTVYFVDPVRLEALAESAFELEGVTDSGGYEASDQKPIFTFRRR